MINRIILLCWLVQLSSGLGSNAQQSNSGKIWIQGDQLVFSSSFNGSQVSNDSIRLTSLYFHHGHSNICDSAGNLLLVSDGCNIYDRHLNFIEGGDTIVPKRLFEFQDGSSGLTQSSIILPFASGKFRVITPTASDSMVLKNWYQQNEGAIFDQLLYAEVDMKANGGLGKVTRKRVPLLEGVKLSKTQMMACRHGDGKSWWLLKQASDTNLVYKFLFTENKVYGPYVQGFNNSKFSSWDICGQAMFSADGTKYATTVQGAGKIFLADFDRCSGTLSNPKMIRVPPQSRQDPSDPVAIDSSTNGLAFSPSGRFLYVNSFYSVQQLDLLDNNISTAWSLVHGRDTSWSEFQQYSNIYPGPDGKLYIGNWDGLGGQMSVVNNPDAKGILCDFCPKCLRFPGLYFQGTTRYFSVTSPPCMPNYSLGSASPICYPAGIPSIPKEPLLCLFPNPTQGMLSVRFNNRGDLRFSDMSGRTIGVYRLQSPDRILTIDLRTVAPGVYSYQYLDEKFTRTSGKLIIMR